MLFTGRSAVCIRTCPPKGSGTGISLVLSSFHHATSKEPLLFHRDGPLPLLFSSPATHGEPFSPFHLFPPCFPALRPCPGAADHLHDPIEALFRPASIKKITLLAAWVTDLRKLVFELEASAFFLDRAVRAPAHLSPSYDFVRLESPGHSRYTPTIDEPSLASCYSDIGV